MVGPVVLVGFAMTDMLPPKARATAAATALLLNLMITPL
jgi:hypothetical protein